MRRFMVVVAATVGAIGCEAGVIEGSGTKADGALLDQDGDGIPNSEDCAPDDPSVGPGQPEICNGLDDDCNGLVDDEADDALAFYADGDGDGTGDPSSRVSACAAPAGFVDNNADCDDADPTRYGGAPEACDGIDNDCDGAPSDAEFDLDGDGFVGCEECDDSRADVFPGAVELCNDRDDDCDGSTDEDVAFFPDSDVDGYGDAAATAVTADCDDAPRSHVANALDCDDADADIHPDATEICDPDDRDEDCDGLVDDADDSAEGHSRYSPDADQDGQGDANVDPLAFCDPPLYYVSLRTDCDDYDDQIYLGAAVLEPSLCTRDGDGDGYGDDSLGGDGEAGTDCNDSDATAYPGASEAGRSVWEDPACDGRGGAISRAGLAIYHSGRYAEAGVALAGGDFDGDGLADLLVGAPGVLSSRFNVCGEAYLLFGDTLASVTATTLDFDDADVIFNRDGQYGIGRTVASAGDVDNDGRDDLFLGSPDRSRAWFYFAATVAADTDQRIGYADADHSFTGDSGSDSLSSYIGSVGDIDGDGLSDTVIADERYSGNEAEQGQVWIFTGATLYYESDEALSLSDADHTIRGESGTIELGSAATGLGDLDGDGIGDMVVGAPWGSASGYGTAHVAYGATLAAQGSSAIDSDDLDHHIEASSSRAGVGEALSSAGDLDGDGLEDLVMGAPYMIGDGVVLVVLGSTLTSVTTLATGSADYELVGEVGGDMAGSAVSATGDIDGDGLNDIVVGAPESDEGGTEAGEAYVVLGSQLGATAAMSLSDAWLSVVGEAAGDQAGQTVDIVGDVDGDGRDDFIVGAPGNDSSAADAGAVYLFFGGS